MNPTEQSAKSPPALLAEWRLRNAYPLSADESLTSKRAVFIFPAEAAREAEKRAQRLGWGRGPFLGSGFIKQGDPLKRQRAALPACDRADPCSSCQAPRPIATAPSPSSTFFQSAPVALPGPRGRRGGAGDLQHDGAPPGSAAKAARGRSAFVGVPHTTLTAHHSTQGDW